MTKFFVVVVGFFSCFLLNWDFLVIALAILSSILPRFILKIRRGGPALLPQDLMEILFLNQMYSAKSFRLFSSFMIKSFVIPPL